jgi:hypothetical protein
MSLKNKCYDELKEIARLNNIFVPVGISRKNLEDHIYKNVNIKNVRYQLLIDIRIYTKAEHYDKYWSLLCYLDDSIKKIPMSFFGPFEIDKVKNCYKLGSVTFDAYGVKRIEPDLIRITLQRKTPFFKIDEDIVDHIHRMFKPIPEDDNDIMYLSPENVEKYGFSKDFQFELDFEKILRIGF